MGLPHRVGIYGGTFDPIHIGHLAVAEEARYVLGLDRVYLVPAARQPLKHTNQGASPQERLEMVRLACRDNPAFHESDVELLRPPPSYTVDTLRIFHERLLPGADLWLILGADAACELPRWYHADQLITLARLAIIGRPGYQVDLKSIAQLLPGFEERCVVIDGPRLDISSSELRARLSNTRPVRYQIPAPVLEYIQARRLYSNTRPEPVLPLPFSEEA